MFSSARNPSTDTFDINPSLIAAGFTSDYDRASTSSKSIRFEDGEHKIPRSTAVLLINFQNEFVDWAGQLHNDVGDLMEKTGMMTKVPHVLRAAR